MEKPAAMGGRRVEAKFPGRWSGGVGPFRPAEVCGDEVRPVPSRAARRTKIPSTEACVRAQLVMITLPLTNRNVLPSVKVDRAAVPLMKLMLALELEPITSITGMVKLVRAAIAVGAILPSV